MDKMTLNTADHQPSALNFDRKKFLSLIGYEQTIIRAENCQLMDSSGRQFIDFSSQYGVMLLGHNHPRLRAALQQCLNDHEPVMVQPFSTRYCEMLTSKLLHLMPGDHYDRVQFTNSGTETVEAALKLARSHTGRKRILATINGFHGKTLGSVKATGTAIYREPFGIIPDDTDHVQYGNLQTLEHALQQEHYAAFIVEPIQGEAGMIEPPAGYLRQAQQLCQRYGTLLIVDEIQTGLWRSGSFLACNSESVEPDIVLLAKGLSGGLVPLGAMICKKGVWTKTFGLFHSSTFANNNLAAAVACALIDTVTESGSGVLEQASTNGAFLVEQLQNLVQNYPLAFTRVRGRGFMLGLELTPWHGRRMYLNSYMSSVGFAVPVVSGYLLNRHGIVCLPTLNSNNVLRIQPPLTISRQQISSLVNALDQLGRLISDERHELLFEVVNNSGNGDPVKTQQPVAAVRPCNNPRSIAGGRCLGRFGFFLHPINDSCIWGDIAFGKSGMSDYHRQQVVEWVRRVTRWGKDRQEAGIACGPERIYNAQGDYVEGYTITSLYKPRELMALNAEQRRLLFDSYFDKIKDLQLDYVGLGAYTSVISRSGLELLDRGVNITTGNSLTAMSCVEAMREVAEQTDRPLSKRCLAIAGAYGSIGRLVALELSGDAKQLVLIGNPLSPQAMESLRTTAGEVYRHVLLGASPSAPIKARLNSVCGIDGAQIERMENHELYDLITAQFEQAGQTLPINIDIRLEPWLDRVDAVLTATSAGRGFIDLSRCPVGTIICDAAQPPDLARQSNCRSDLVVFSGGELMLPHSGFRFGSQNLTGLESGTTLACMGETMVLAMSSIRSHQSVGPNPCIQKARKISQLARQFGLIPKVPELSRGGQKAMDSLTVA